MEYSPSEITELQAVPLILQGGTDSGGSNIFAGYVAGCFLFGLIASFLLLSLKLYPKYGSTFRNILLGFIFAFLLSNLPYLLEFFSGCLGVPKLTMGARPYYFVCDYIQIFVLFSLAYLLSVLWIWFLSKRVKSYFLQYLLCPLVLVLLFVLADTGITPKVGKNLNSGVIPDYSSHSLKHSWLLNLHRVCTACVDSTPSK